MKDHERPNEPLLKQLVRQSADIECQLRARAPRRRHLILPSFSSLPTEKQTKAGEPCDEDGHQDGTRVRKRYSRRRTGAAKVEAEDESQDQQQSDGVEWFGQTLVSRFL